MQATKVAAGFDLDWARSQFPSLKLAAGDKPALYLDNPAGTQVPARTIDAIGKYLMTANANSHGPFLTSARTDELIADTRQAMASFLNAPSPREIVLGPNMTTMTFAFSRAFARDLKAGDEIIVTELDHDGNVTPWTSLAEQGIVIRKIPVRVEDCTLDLDALPGLLSERTRLVAVGMASNASGTVNDVARVAQMAHQVGALVWVDAVHAGPHLPIDVQALGVDFLICSAYKFFGPHLGILWGRGELLDAIRPYQVRPAPQQAPEKYETGTKNHECLAGLLATLSYIADLGRTTGGNRAELGETGTITKAALSAAMRATLQYERGVSAALLDGFAAVPGLHVYGITDKSRLDERVPTFIFNIDGIATADLNKALADNGVFAWDGNYYALEIMNKLGLEGKGGALRVGAVHYNTPEDVDRLISTLQRIVTRARDA